MINTATSTQRPAVLLYDGDCGICREWVDYWGRLTGDRVMYRAYQEAAAEYPRISPEDVAAAIHLIEADGSVSKGAEATYRLYQGHPPQSWLIRLYRNLPGFAPMSEAAYTFFSRYRGLLALITHLFWGRDFQPPRYRLVTWLFLRFLGCIYFSAFLSFMIQADALIGSNGVLPLSAHLDLVREVVGQGAYLRLPTLFWFSSTDNVINLVCGAGVLLSVCLALGFIVRTSLVLLYVLYLSLLHGGQVFMSFQWDMLLLECGFLAIFLPWGSTIIIWLYRWLVFRYMLLSGLVKIRSADTSWESLTALSYHFETQPLPTPIAWYAHHLPETVLRAATGMTLAIELFVPVLLFAPRRFRHFAAWCFLLLQAVILLTGNYNFFNLLSIIMCLFLFDDAAITRLVPRRLTARLIAMKMPSAGRIATGCAILMAAVSVILGGSQIHQVMFPERGKEISSLQRVLAPFAIVNSYGPFAVMTRERNEIVIEGLGEERTWHEYRFKYKPGDPERCPGWVAPHQPRIDWQMWFAALSTPQREPWFQNLLLGLLQNTGPVTAIFADNPFPDKPPRILRARFYRYTFTSYEERRETGRCWNRQLLGDYIPPVILR